MKFAPIVPVKYLHRVASTSHFHMVLAHWLTEPDYLKFYQRMKARGDFIILDNGACELKTSVPIEELLNWNNQLGGADVLVIPDTEEGDNTELFLDSMSFLVNKPFEEKLQGTHLMFVPHSLLELDQMLAVFLPVDICAHPIYIGLNRALGDEYEGGRPQIIRDNLQSDKAFHLLGMYKNPVAEVEEVKGLGDKVLGIDSSLPYRICRVGRRVDEYRPFPQLIDMYENGLSPEVIKHCRGEIEWFCGWTEECK